MRNNERFRTAHRILMAILCREDSGSVENLELSAAQIVRAAVALADQLLAQTKDQSSYYQYDVK